MIFRRLIAFPESKQILVLHVLAAPFLAVQLAVIAMAPFLLRRHFCASELQVVLATSSAALLSMLAIFWNQAYVRLQPGRYLLVMWLLSVLPLGGVAFCSSAWPVLLLVLVSAAGMGGIQSVIGDILRNCYPPRSRNRVFSILKVLEQSTVMVSTFGIGVWLDHNVQAYRIYFPLAVALIGTGLFLVARITQQRLFQERLVPASEELRESLLRGLFGAFRKMRAVLAADPRFRRYEAAYCVYGLGWNICNALVPFVAIDILRLRYGQVGFSTQAACQFTLILMLLPASLLTDRLGPIRMSAWSFAWLLLWPLGLMVARNVVDLTIVTVLYGIGITAVNLTWTLGPVTLARNAAHAPQYLAIHATLVSVRAVLGQFPPVYLYYRYHQIWPSLVTAALLFATGAVMMARLERDSRLEMLRPAPEGELVTVS